MRKIITHTSFCTLLLLTIVLTMLPLARMFHKVEIDYNEGWNAFYSLKAIRGLDLYTHSTEWTSLNYPPTSFYLNGLIGSIFGDFILAGRIVSLISLFLISLSVMYIVYKFSHRLYESSFAALFCLGSFAGFATHYVAMFDPQMLGQVFTLLALMIYFINRESIGKTGHLLIIAILCALGLSVKHSIIAVPLAISIDIFILSKKIFVKWLLVCLSVGIILTGFFLFVFGKELFAQLSFPRTFSISKLIYDSLRFGGKVGLPILFLIPWLFQIVKIDYLRIFFLYLLVGIIAGVIGVSGFGVDVNAFFDSIIGLSLIAGLFFADYNSSKLSKIYTMKFISAVIPIVLISGIIFIFFLKISRIGTDNEIRYGLWRPGILSKINALGAAHLSDAGLISEYKGPVSCQNLLLNYLSGKPFIFDPFYVGEAIVNGKIKESSVLSLIESGYFDIIQLKSVISLPESNVVSYGAVKKIGMSNLTENMKVAIARHYHILWNSVNGWFYVYNR